VLEEVNFDGVRFSIFRDNNADVGKIILTKLSWLMPHVELALEEKLTLIKIIERKVSLPVAFRMRQCESIPVSQSTNFTWRLSVKSGPEKPRWIVVVFQTTKDANQEANPSVFDHVNVDNVFVMLNSTRYPAIDYENNFTWQKFPHACARHCNLHNNVLSYRRASIQS